MQTTIIIRVQGPAATAINFAPAAGPFIVPVPPGTVFGRLSVLPAAWVGDLVVSGPDARFFAVSPVMDIMANQPLTTVREYNITVTGA